LTATVLNHEYYPSNILEIISTIGNLFQISAAGYFSNQSQAYLEVLKSIEIKSIESFSSGAV